MRFEFEEVLQIVDPETVLSMINKTSMTSTCFKVKPQGMEICPVGPGCQVITIPQIG